MASTLAAPRSSRRGGPLPRLWIDSDLSNTKDQPSTTPRSSVASSSQASLATSSADTSVTPTSPEPFFVLCLYDFDAEDAHQLSFRRNDILDVVKREDSGWWAALREDDNRVGWIPHAFVEPISDETADKLRAGNGNNVRVYGQDTVPLAAHGSPEPFTDPFITSPSVAGHSFDWMHLGDGHKIPIVQHVSDKHRKDSAADILSPLAPPHEGIDDNFLEFESELSPTDRITGRITAPRNTRRSFFLDDTPIPSTPPPPLIDSPSPVPATPRTASLRRSRSINLPSLDSVAVISEHQRSRSESSKLGGGRHLRRRPLLIDDQSSLNRLTTLFEAHNVEELDHLIMSPVVAESFDAFTRTTRAITPRPDKVKQITGDDEAQSFHDARLVHTTWYLRPAHGDEEIQLQGDGSVRAGTLRALVERLTVDFPKSSQAVRFRKMFLLTYKSFTTADEAFSLLRELYNITHPTSLTLKELEQWKEKKLKPTRLRILQVLRMWCEDYGLLQDDPLLARPLVDFLCSVSNGPPAAVAAASQVLKSVEHFISVVPSTPQSATRRKKSKGTKLELQRMDVAAMAEHLCMIQQRLYSKIRPQECFEWLNTQSGHTVKSINAFRSLNDKLGTWVKLSILSTEGIGKRADMVDFWIKVAEKCSALHNYAAMHAIVASVYGPLVSRIHLTWAYVGRRSHLEQLAKLDQPTGDYAAYRVLQRSAEGPCVPFVDMYLTIMMRVHEQHPDNVVPASPSPGATFSLINFEKREMWYETMDSILRHQSKPFCFAEDPATTNFIETSIAVAGEKDQSTLWAKSQEIQHAERAHMDIRKGLEMAGF